jgi:hypothetical protein
MTAAMVMGMVLCGLALVVGHEIGHKTTRFEKRLAQIEDSDGTSEMMEEAVATIRLLLKACSSPVFVAISA